MPTIDGGHYFLTVLAPVDAEPCQRADGGFTAPSQLLREALAVLPTARQSPETVASGRQSPFARCRRTHFARFALIDQPAFNGRDSMGPLMALARGVDPAKHQPVDTLSRPWLIFAADFDAREDEPDGGLRSWAEHLWRQSEAELRAAFRHCLAFDGVRDGAGFGAWLDRCRVETLMSFNDYYVPMPDLKGWTLRQVAAGFAAGALALTLLAGLLLGLQGWGWLWALALLVPAALISAAGAVWALNRRGARPFPASPTATLSAVLKALFVQQRFALLAERLAGADDAALHAAFGAFLRETRPDALDAPTQPPGVIRSDDIPLVDHQRVRARGMLA